jgi:hypothetical protein
MAWVKAESSFACQEPMNFEPLCHAGPAYRTTEDDVPLVALKATGRCRDELCLAQGDRGKVRLGPISNALERRALLRPPRGIVALCRVCYGPLGGR